MTRERIGFAVAWLLELGLLALMVVVITAVAAPGLSQAVARQGAPPADEVPGAGSTIHPAIAPTSTLTNVVYLPVTLGCYGPCGACEHSGQGHTEVVTMTSLSCLATKIRLDLTKRATGYGFSLWEVEAYGPDDTEKTNNLLPGGTACVSSVEGNYPDYYGPHLVIDGLMSTRWSSDWSEPQWLVIVLPEPQLVKYVVLKWEAAYATEYQVTVVEAGTDCP